MLRQQRRAHELGVHGRAVFRDEVDDKHVQKEFTAEADVDDIGEFHYGFWFGLVGRGRDVDLDVGIHVSDVSFFAMGKGGVCLTCARRR